MSGSLSTFLLFGILETLFGIFIPDRVLNVLFAATVTIALVGLVLVAYGTFARIDESSISIRTIAHAVALPSEKIGSRNHAIKSSGEGGTA